MSIGRIGGEALRGVLTKTVDQAPAQDGGSGSSFGEALARALSDVNQAQLTSEDAAIKLATGQAANLQDVVLATEKASLALQFTMAIRNKVVDAYNEIMRMPV